MALRMRNVPAVFEWSDLLSTPRSPLYLAGPDPLSVQLSLYFDEEQQTVFLKIRVLLVLEGEADDKASGEFLYGLVYPSNVVLLLQDPAHHLPAGVSPVLHGPTTACLRLVLSKPVSITLPSDVTLPLRASRGSQQLLSSLELLAMQTVLAVHVDQHNISSATAVQRLCKAFTNGTIRQHPRYDTLQGFYIGRGATVLDGLAFASSNANKRVEDDGPNNDETGRTSTPPLYANNQEAPPPQLFAQAPERRSWAHADTCSAASDDTEPFTQPVPPSYDQAPPPHLPAPKKRKWDAHGAACDDTEPLTQHKLQMESLLALQQEQTRKFLTLASDLITARLRAHLSEEVDKMRRENAEEWERVIEPYIINEVDDSVERSLERKKEEFQEAVRQECLNDLKDDLESGLVSITLPR